MSKSIIGFVVSTIYLAAIAVFLLKFEKGFPSLPPNELGDFLAGIFAPLAFLWLVLGYFQQGEELRQNTKALELQVQELKHSVQQQRELVAITRLETETTRKSFENQQRKELRAAQPIFEVLVGGWSGDFGVVNALVITIKNIGKEVSGLTFSTSEGKIAPFSAPIFGSNERRTLYISDVKTGVAGLVLTIKYTDALGLCRQQYFCVRQNTNSEFYFDHPKSHVGDLVDKDIER